MVKEYAVIMDCSVCGKAAEQAEPNLCLIHARALLSVRQAYEVWASAFGGITPAEFLNRVARLKGTGRNAKEIVEFLQQHPERWK
jgi:hypothetical protein